MDNLILIGLPGSGKTTLGKLAAQRLGLHFTDLDEVIEVRAGKTIPQLFAEYGEAYFRQLESEAVKSVSDLRSTVISTGGGVILDPSNVAFLQRAGHVIFLDRPVEQIADSPIPGRPLLTRGSEALYELAAHRRRLYLTAADAVITNEGTVESALEALIDCAASPLYGNFAVIGDPIGHSQSPILHRAVFKALGISARYRAKLVTRELLTDFAGEVRCGSLQGFNATIPHKQALIDLLDELEDEAAACGAVNTVVQRNGRLIGANTDMPGLSLALKMVGTGYAGRRVVVLGTGGAAAGIIRRAAFEGAESITVLGRRPQAAQELLDRADSTKTRLCAGGFTPEQLHTAMRDCDLLLNATPLGMSGMNSDFVTLDFIEALPDKAVVFDLIYSPPETSLLAAARARGLCAHNGLGMLICQALLADELFLERTLDLNTLYPIIETTLIERNSN